MNIKSNDLITKNQFKIIQNKISIISGLFKNYRTNQKNKKNLKSKILVNNQLLQEIERRKQEALLILQEKKIDLIKAINKKQVIIGKLKKKFSDIEIYIRRECQYYAKYKNLYIHFYMDSFINNNTKILNIIKNKKQENENIIDSINIVNSENIEYKRSYYCISYNYIDDYIENNKRKNMYKIDDINKFLVIQEDKNKYFQNEIETMSKIYKNMLKDYQYGIKYKNNQNNNKDKHIFTNKILNNLNKLPFDENNSNFFKSDIDSSNSYPDNINLDSSELWSASEIEK